jgi:hypothetical protein
MHEKEKRSPLLRSYQRGYFENEKEKVRERTSMEEKSDFGNPKIDSVTYWLSITLLLGFRSFAVDFYQVYSSFKNGTFLY